MRNRYRFAVIGYVVMPEHIHLLVSEPQVANPSTVVQAVKLGFSRRLTCALTLFITFGRAASTISTFGVSAKRSKS
jgi:REP element-mobilizing transposase RayT